MILNDTLGQLERLKIEFDSLWKSAMSKTLATAYQQAKNTQEPPTLLMLLRVQTSKMYFNRKNDLSMKTFSSIQSTASLSQN